MRRPTLLILALCPLSALAQNTTEHTYSAVIDSGGKLRVQESITIGTAEPTETKEAASRGPYDAVFRPEGPHDALSVTVKGQSWLPAAVWASGAATAEYTTRGGRGVTYTWKPGGKVPAPVVWSSYKTWAEADKGPRRAINGKLVLPENASKALAGLPAAEIVGKVYPKVPVKADIEGSWEDSRKADEIFATAFKAGGVSLHERAVVLMAALEAAGHTVKMASYVADDDLLDMPVGLIAPSAYSAPAVALQTPNGWALLDPAATYTTPGQIPLTMAGRLARVEGEPPQRLGGSVLGDGTIVIQSIVQLGSDGSTWSASMAADRAGQEALRAVLSSKGKEHQAALVEVMAEGSEVTSFAETGIRKYGDALTVTVQGAGGNANIPVGLGRGGSLKPLFVGKLAAAVPSNIRVREVVTVLPPPDHVFVSTERAVSSVGKEAGIYRSLQFSPQQLVLSVEAIAPGRGADASKVKEQFLKFAEVGVGFSAFAAGSGKYAGSIKKTEGSNTEKAIQQALLYWAFDDDAKAQKSLKLAFKKGTPIEVIAAMEKYTPPGVEGPWNGLSPWIESEADRLQLIDAMGRKGNRRLAWQMALGLTTSTTPETVVGALLSVAKLQGEQPNKNDDPDGNRAWKPPDKLIGRALSTRNNLADPKTDIRPLLPAAEQAILAGKPGEARVGLMEMLSARSQDPRLPVLQATIDVLEGKTELDFARSSIDRALKRFPGDAELWLTAEFAFEQMGLRSEALNCALASARIAGDDPHAWLKVADAALDLGDMDTALQATRLASDMDPALRIAGSRLKHTAMMAGELALSNLGAERSQLAPEAELLPMDIMLDQAGGHTLAMLNGRDAQVMADKRLLAMRGKLRAMVGDLDGAASDGWTLKGMRSADGDGILFAASASQIWNPGAFAALNKVAKRGPMGRLARMEYGLVTGAADPRSDAPYIKGDDRAAALAAAMNRPANAAAVVTGWTAGQANPKVRAKSGYKYASRLSGPKGAVGYGNALAQVGVIYTTPVTEVVPPPVASIWTMPPSPLRTLENGAKLYALDGGMLTLYAAIMPFNEGSVITLGFNESAPGWALDVINAE